MPEQLTEQQHIAVSNRGGKLLVSAAAGSGKTKVLVDRLLSYLTDPSDPANLDDFLIITYTKAAAAELRGKIAEKLNERIAETPANKHLHRQMQRLYLTKISTVHSFCADLIREYAYRLDVPADFRVAEEAECLGIQQAVLEQILEEAYETAFDHPDFCALIDSQGLGRDDRQIPQILLQVYSSARCHLSPENWLQWCLNAHETWDISDATDTIWGKYLLEDLQATLDLHVDALKCCVRKAEQCSGMEKAVALLRDTVRQLEQLRGCKLWDEIRAHAAVDYGRLTFGKSCEDSDLADRIKAVRNACKKSLEKKLRRFTDTNEQVLSDITASAASARGIVSWVRKFSAAYDRAKRARHILDFSDLEHIVLDLLIGRNREGYTAVAFEIGQRFREVMVDEYQDSNAVQDAIFSALTKKQNNCFMVGDVKQSIYQFRLADPAIFLDKYNTFPMWQDAERGQGRKVLLSDNFRSCGAVIDAVNDIFSDCMSPKVGGLAYGAAEMLNEGLPHAALPDSEVELYGIRVQEDTYAEEACFVAERISQLLDGKHMVRKKDVLVPITPEDIVILLRSPGSVGGQFYNALEEQGIRCDIGGSVDLLKAEEIEILCAYLQIISNPLQDIPLITVLLSRVFGFSADELAAIRSQNKHTDFFTALKKSDSAKAMKFIEELAILRQSARMTGICELIEQIFLLTKLDSVYSAMPDGAIRLENLQAFCELAGNFDSDGNHDLGHFLEHIEKLREQGFHLQENKSAGAVTIMSIHKSKGLEFPVVFLCGLSREFNKESIRAQVLCDKSFGLGLSCVDAKNRVRYPTLAKRAIAAKMLADGLSEEMRVLYVAMTRARDRLIMTYASKYLENDVSDLSVRMIESNPLLITSEVDCPGKWVLYSALKRIEAGALHRFTSQKPEGRVSQYPWLIQVFDGHLQAATAYAEENFSEEIPEKTLQCIERNLTYSYPYKGATIAPSKLTATQLKGRIKDQEAAENALNTSTVTNWRKPGQQLGIRKATDRGNAYHKAMQHICFAACVSEAQIKDEILRLVDAGYISQEQASILDISKLMALFASPLGKKLQESKHLLREFKFSVLKDSGEYFSDLQGEKILLQGVVDCAIIEETGITVIDFKTDYVTQETVSQRTEDYRKQVDTYAGALENIFQKPVIQKLLYYFQINQWICID